MSRLNCAPTWPAVSLSNLALISSQLNGRDAIARDRHCLPADCGAVANDPPRSRLPARRDVAGGAQFRRPRRFAMLSGLCPRWAFDRGSELCRPSTSASPQKLTSDPNEKLVAMGHEQTSCVAATMCSLQHRFPTMTCSQPHLYASATRTSRQIANRRFGKSVLNVESDISFLVELLRPIVLEWG
jgi:hypothetical protein